MPVPADPPFQPAAAGAGSDVLSSLLDLLGVTHPDQRARFEQLVAAQARRRIPPASAERAIANAFAYHASLAELALGVVQALHGGEAAPPGAPLRFNETALSLGLMNVGAWTDLLTCAPLRHAARLLLTPQQQQLLLYIVQKTTGEVGR